MDNNANECRRLQNLVAELIAAQETERWELAGELQHQMAQHLTALKYHIESLRSAKPEGIQERVGEARLLVDELVDWVRRLSLRLRPSMLDDLGLLPALNWYSGCFQEQTGVQMDFQHRGLDRRFSPELEIAAFRVAQELLQAAADHPGNRRVVFRVWADEQSLRLQLEDENRTCGEDDRPELARVQQRVAWLNGTMEIAGGSVTGSRATVQFPLMLTNEEQA